MNQDTAVLYRFFQRALLFNIPPGVRMISFELTWPDTIMMQVASAFELDETARDDLFAAAVEVEGYYSRVVCCMVEFVVDDGPIDALPRLEHLVFALAR